jgi:hypothetical protein
MSFPLDREGQKAAKQLVALTDAWNKGNMSDQDYMASCATNDLWRKFSDTRGTY